MEVKKLFLVLSLFVWLLPAAASAVCTLPTGSVGNAANPPSGYITAIKPTLTQPFKLEIHYNGGAIVGFVDWGFGNASITGPGWTGAKVTSLQFVASPSCGAGKLCMRVNGGSLSDIQFSLSGAYPFGNGISWSGAGAGLQRIDGIGNRHVKFYGWSNGAPKVDTRVSSNMAWCVSAGDNGFEQLLPNVAPRLHAAEEALISKLLRGY